MGKFDKHLDECKQCANHPFDLCSIGERCLYEQVRDTIDGERKKVEKENGVIKVGGK